MDDAPTQQSVTPTATTLVPGDGAFSAWQSIASTLVMLVVLYGVRIAGRQAALRAQHRLYYLKYCCR